MREESKGIKMAFIRKIRKNGRIYRYEVESYRDGGKVKQRYIRSLGPESPVDGDTSATGLAQLQVDKVVAYGPVIVLESIARELGLFEILGTIAEPVLTLTFSHALGYRSVKETEKWYLKTDLPKILNVDKMPLNRLYGAIDDLSELDFEAIEKSSFENLTRILGEDESGVVYDGSNTHLTGSLSQLASYGKDKEGVTGRKLIQIGLGVTREMGLPIFHQVHRGNVHDSKMFREAILKFNSMGVKNGLAVFDRGITSKESISRLAGFGWKCLAGVPAHKGVKALISDLDFSKLENFRNLVVQGDTKFFSKSIPFSMDSTKGKLIVLVNHLKKQKKRLDRMAQITSAREAWEVEGAKIPTHLERYFTSAGRINTHAVKRAEHLDGLSFIFTNSKLSIEKAVHQYFAKDIVERCFRLHKSVIGLRPIHVQLDNRIRAHIMICYLALVLLTTIRIRMQNINKFHDPGAILRELDSIYKVYMRGRVKNARSLIPFSKVNTVSNRQMQIIQAIAPNLGL